MEERLRPLSERECYARLTASATRSSPCFRQSRPASVADALRRSDAAGVPRPDRPPRSAGRRRRGGLMHACTRARRRAVGSARRRSGCSACAAPVARTAAEAAHVAPPGAAVLRAAARARQPRSRTFSHPASRSSSAASTPAALRRRREPRSPIRATTSGGSCTRPASRRACSRPRSRSCCSTSATGSRTPRGARHAARASSAARTSRGRRSGSQAIADELRPRAIAFVGKAAYEGTYRERPELGLQERRLGDTLLFVLPSTSPANAAVPWEERLRWFRALRELLLSSRS